MWKRSFLTAAVALLILSSASMAENNAAAQKVLAVLNGILNETNSVSSIKETTFLPGYYEATVGTNILYVSADGRYLVQGTVFDLANKTNITENHRNTLRADLLKTIDASQTIIFGEPNAAHVVTVFTDVDCGYCRKLHTMMEGYNKAGITIRYMAYPRAGKDSKSFQKAVAVWCADNKQQAMSDAKAGKEPPMTATGCDNPVAEQLALGAKLGITGTPTIFLDNGAMIPGFVAPDQLAAKLKALDG